MAQRNESAMGIFSIRIPRLYDAPPERVFRAWTDPVSVKAWLASGGQAVIDARENGLFFLGMAVNDRVVPHYGRYLRVESPRLLEFTWVSEHTHGKESVVLIELSARGTQTELTLTHDGLPSEKAAEGHTGGWTSFLDKLVGRLL
jgi:uncharacterized protein YndB with AHSA1/START domain